MCKSRPWRWRPITHRGHGHAPGAVWARICLAGLLLFAAGGALTLGKAHERGCDLSPASEGSGRPNQAINHGFPTSFAASRTQREFPPPQPLFGSMGRFTGPALGGSLKPPFPWMWGCSHLLPQCGWLRAGDAATAPAASPHVRTGGLSAACPGPRHAQTARVFTAASRGLQSVPRCWGKPEESNL